MRKILIVLAGVVASLLLESCCSSVLHPPAALLYPYHSPPPILQPITIAELEHADLTQLVDCPIVDVHSHTFNALYLPLMNIARGRVMDAVGDLPLTDDIAVILANGLIGAALENQNKDGQPAPPPSNVTDPNRVPLIADQLGINAKHVLRGAQAMRGTTPTDLRFTPEALEARPDLETILRQNLNWELFGKAVFGNEISSRSAKLGSVGLGGDVPLVAFLRILVSADSTIRKSLRDAFKDKVALFVHHTLDMGPTYGQKPDEKVSAEERPFRDYKTWQLPQVRKLDLDSTSESHFVHFVAFSPFRAEGVKPAGGWQNSSVIRDIETAMEQGAWGVKYYPPSGYRPSGNRIPARPKLDLLGQQWDSRYSDPTHGHRTNQDLDDLNFEFFRYCAEHDIPVFAHCNYGEFQAANGYGEAMAHPAYYREVLEKLECLPKPLYLRLCFGHAGGPDFWFGDNDADRREWGQQVYELCTHFRNVYCEVGVLAEILNPIYQARFANRIAALFAQPTAPHRYDFGTKILYGTDWFMPDSAGAGEKFLIGYRQVFLCGAFLKKYYRNFFCRNALTFLGLDEEANPRLCQLTAAQRAYLDLLRRHAAE